VERAPSPPKSRFSEPDQRAGAGTEPAKSASWLARMDNILAHRSKTRRVVLRPKIKMMLNCPDRVASSASSNSFNSALL